LNRTFLPKKLKFFHFSTCMLFLFSALAGVFFCGCKSSSGARPNIFIISIESLRRDHVSCYGYSRHITPNIDGLARTGVIFDKAYSQCSWTKPSVASTFTSTYYSYHQVTNPTPNNANSSENRNSSFPILRNGFTTIASFLAGKGYSCCGWTANRQLLGAFGFGRGFNQYDATLSSDEQVVERVIANIGSSHQPWFIFVHLMAPHWDYNPPLKYRNYDSYPSGIPINGNNWREISDGKIPLSAEDLEHNIALYDGEIAYVDDMIGRMIEALNGTEEKKNTIVIIMSDHGEEFMEHGGVGHGRSLYEEVIRVPLIFFGPGILKGRKNDALVQNIDVFPTVAALCGFHPPEGLQGLNMEPVLKTKAAKIPRRFVYSELENLHAVIGVNFKYLFDPLAHRQELYDLARDPGEKNNIAFSTKILKIRDDFAKNGSEWLAQNLGLSARMGKSEYINIPQETINQLKALGYLR